MKQGLPFKTAARLKAIHACRSSLGPVMDTTSKKLYDSKWTRGCLHGVIGLVVLLTAPCRAASFDERLVAAVLMAEARGEGIVGMTAVGEVIANRARKRQIPPSVVVRESYQFSPLNRTKPQALVARYEKMPQYREALRIAGVVIHTPAALPGLTAGADHFEHLRAPIPRWAQGQRPVAVVGGHRFWRLRTLVPGGV